MNAKTDRSFAALLLTRYYWCEGKIWLLQHSKWRMHHCTTSFHVATSNSLKIHIQYKYTNLQMTLRNIMLCTLRMFNMPFAAFSTLDKAFLPPLFLQTCSDILDLTLNLFWLCLKFYDFAFSHNVWVENHNFRLLNKIQRILNLHLTLNISLYPVYSGEGSVVTCDNRPISSLNNSCSNVSCLVAFCIFKKNT